jgi:photosystem II stability/assembly factor-like uncharacterized protein
MGNPRDWIDDWLTAEVEPLAPPPGTFERIKKRARRRKVSRAVMSAAGIVIVIAAGVAVPRIATTLQSHSGPAGRPVAAGTPPAIPRPTATGKGSERPNTGSSSKLAPPASHLSSGSSGSPVPPNFQPTSVTFVGSYVGAVIGQAGTRGHCATRYCTSLAGTSDYGTSWYGVSAPRTGPPDGSQGVSQIRFLTTSDGWAFGPQLWVTHNGGASWTRENTDGMRVTDLETAGDRAFALFATCTGSGASYAATCTSFSLYSSQATSDQWLPVPGAAADLGLPQTAGTQAASASLVLTGGPTTGRGYLLAPSGELLSGPLTGAAWTMVGQPKQCLPGPPGPEGQPTGALLAAGSGRLILVCNKVTSAAGDSQAKIVMQSSDGGTSWSVVGDAPSAGSATSVDAAQGNLVVLATDAGIYRSGTGGRTWQLTQASPNGTAAAEHGFSYVGMTSSVDGVALPADPGLHEVFITTDGGSAWQPHAISAP